MADVNNCLGKRKTLCQQIIFELEGDEELLPNSTNSGDNEPVSKMLKKEESVDATDTNLYQETSQNSVETNASVLEKLTELQEENKKLKKQLEELSTKLCKCNLNHSGSDTTDDKQESQITIRFLNDDIANSYKAEFKKFLKTIFEFTFIDNNLDINVTKKDDVDIVTDDTSPSKKRKRKKSKSKLKDSLFIVDTTPSIPKHESNLKYTSKYLVIAETENTSEKEVIKCISATVCFNCDQNHSLRDCPEPKNYAKINAARNKLKQQQLTKARYHQDEDQKYAHLKPGEISTDLKDALGLYSDELPPYIYRMRKCGYPPGWMEDARVIDSNISLFDMDGKESTKRNSKVTFNPEKVIEYPGFNMPMTKGIRDNYKYHDSPPYSEKCSKTIMLQYLSKMLAKQEDNLETCDMELDQGNDEEMAPPGCATPTVPPKPTRVGISRMSPSLIDLEAKKKALLEELDDSTTNNSNVEKTTTITPLAKTEIKAKTETIKDDPSISLNDSLILSESFVVIDQTSEIHLDDSVCNESIREKTENNDEIKGVSTPKSDSVTKSTFGTPMVKSASPYSRLPNPDNFSKDISPVINFENLPNATGKYEQMNGLLQKIRRTLKTNFNAIEEIVSSTNENNE